jgi:hypothetical protein
MGKAQRLHHLHVILAYDIPHLHKKNPMITHHPNQKLCPFTMAFKASYNSYFAKGCANLFFILLANLSSIFKKNN